MRRDPSTPVETRAHAGALGAPTASAPPPRGILSLLLSLPASPLARLGG